MRSGSNSKPLPKLVAQQPMNLRRKFPTQVESQIRHIAVAGCRQPSGCLCWKGASYEPRSHHARPAVGKGQAMSFVPGDRVRVKNANTTFVPDAVLGLTGITLRCVHLYCVQSKQNFGRIWLVKFSTKFEGANEENCLWIAEADLIHANSTAAAVFDFHDINRRIKKWLPL